MVSIMTALYFEHLRAADRVSVKPHAAPVLHAIEFLLGKLDAETLTTLRAYGGLQSYPSRTRIPWHRISPPGLSGSGPLHRSGAPSHIATWPGISTFHRAGGTSRSLATPSSTRAPVGRRSSIQSSPASERSCGSSTSIGSHSIGSCPMSLPGVSRECSLRRDGRRSRSSTGAGSRSSSPVSRACC